MVSGLFCFRSLPDAGFLVQSVKGDLFTASLLFEN